MLLNTADSGLLLVDVQQKLTPWVEQSDQLIANCRWLLELAQVLDIPILASEHYAQGLGATVPALSELLTTEQVIAKVEFSCGQNQACQQAIAYLNKPQWVLAGIEAHVCVLQTALDLAITHNVFVVADAISSRDPKDKALALQRLTAHGVGVVSREMVFFEWLQRAATPEFKQLSQQFIKRSDS
ncbi:MAG: isochorismatase family protein [Legionellales bacterium]|nr:isochorismatase family protein [Legionellales bacterium]